MTLRLVATCALGLEELLEGELRDLGMADVGRQRGAVSFRGVWRDVLRANWRLRTANRVLVELGSWTATDGDALARGAERLVTGRAEWAGIRAEELFDPRRTFALRATTAASRVTDARWVALKVKDGIADGQRRRFRRRSSIDKKSPDLPLRVWLHRDRASLLLDTSGEPLDRRGYRVTSTQAPVREQLAAALILAAGWDGKGPVVDPMCGSGTLLAEAGAIALGLAPGRLRPRWAFEQLPGYPRGAWNAVRREPIEPLADDPAAVRLYGVDLSRQAIEAARSNLEAAGLASRATLSTGDAFTWEPPDTPGLLVVNPAYGERLDEAGDQWPRLGDLMKQRYAGWRAVVLAGGEGLGKHIGLKPSRRIPVRNGPLEARILVFELY